MKKWSCFTFLWDVLPRSQFRNKSDLFYCLFSPIYPQYFSWIPCSTPTFWPGHSSYHLYSIYPYWYGTLHSLKKFSWFWPWPRLSDQCSPSNWCGESWVRKWLRFLSTKYFVIVAIHAQIVLLPRKVLLVGIDESIDNFLAIFFVFHFLVEVEIEIGSLNRFVVVEFEPILQLFFGRFHFRQ